jgi:hypothetical protein
MNRAGHDDLALCLAPFVFYEGFVDCQSIPILLTIGFFNLVLYGTANMLHQPLVSSNQF